MTRHVSLALCAILPAGAAWAADVETGSTKVLSTVEVRADRETGDGAVSGIVAKQSSAWTKTNTSLLETPQAVTVITQDQIAAQGATTIDEAVRYSPGILGGNFGSDPRSDWLLVRGFKPARFLDGMSTPDGTWTGVARMETYGMERIDVLKGPSSVLYGQMPPGGMVNLVSKRPTADMVNEVGLTLGNFETKELTLDVGGKLNEDGTLLYRLTGLARNGDATTDYGHDDRYYIAPALTWHPNADTSFTVLASHQKADTALAGGFLPSQGTLLYNPNGEIRRDVFTGEPDFDKYEKEMNSIGYLFEHRFNKMWQVRQNLRYTEASVDHQMVGANGFVLGSDGNPVDYRTINRYTWTPHEQSHMFTIDNQVQADFATGSFAHTVLAGLDYRRGKNDLASGFGSAPTLDIFDPVYSGGITVPADSSHVIQKQSQTGFYLQDQIGYDRWLLTLSGRQDWVKTDSDDLLYPSNTTTNDESKFSGRVGLNYVFDNGFAPYIAYSQSFQPTPGTDFNGQTFKSTTGTQIEAGVKYQPKGSRSLITAAFYDITQKNVLTVDPDHLFYSVQQGKIGVRGFELDGKFELSRSLSAMASYTFTDTEVKESSDPSTIGNQIINVPKHQASAWLDYTVGDGALRGLGVGGGVRYVGASYGDLANEWRTPGYTLFDALAHYDFSNVRLQLNVNNLFDKRYVSNCTSAAWCYYGYARTVMATAKYMW